MLDARDMREFVPARPSLRVLGPLPGRVAGSDLIWSLSRAAAERGRAVFMLGGATGTAEAAAAKLRERYSGLVVTGTHCPPVGFEQDPTEIAAIISKLEAAQPDI